MHDGMTSRMPTETARPSFEEKGFITQGAERGQVHDPHMLRLVAAGCAGDSRMGVYPGGPAACKRGEGRIKAMRT